LRSGAKLAKTPTSVIATFLALTSRLADALALDAFVLRILARPTIVTTTIRSTFLVVAVRETNALPLNTLREFFPTHPTDAPTRIVSALLVIALRFTGEAIAVAVAKQPAPTLDSCTQVFMNTSCFRVTVIRGAWIPIVAVEGNPTQTDPAKAGLLPVADRPIKADVVVIRNMGTTIFRVAIVGTRVVIVGTDQLEFAGLATAVLALISHGTQVVIVALCLIGGEDAQALIAAVICADVVVVALAAATTTPIVTAFGLATLGVTTRVNLFKEFGRSILRCR